MKTFRTLDLAIKFHELVERIDYAGNLRDQLLRAASSIALNLAEGNARSSVKEKKRFYQTAYGSLKECQTIFVLMRNKDQRLEQLADHLGASLYKLNKSKIVGF